MPAALLTTHTHAHTHSALHCSRSVLTQGLTAADAGGGESSPVQSFSETTQMSHTACAMCNVRWDRQLSALSRTACSRRTDGGGSDARLVMGRKRLQDNCLIYTLCLNKKTLNLASCSCDKHGLILITISTTLHQQTQLSLTNRATHLCKWNAVSDLLATCACLPICVIMLNVVVLR